MTDATHEDIISEENPVTDENQAEETGTEQEQVAQIPDKYQGKSAEEIIAMHQNAEKELSRLGNELGENRKLVDKLLQTEQFQPPVPQEEEFDWDYDTEGSTKKLVQKEVSAVKQELDSIKQATALEKFKADFPSFQEDSGTQEFQEWVQQSEYRTNLYNKNHNGIDLVAARELMQGWNDTKAVLESLNEKSKENRQEALKGAALEKGSSSASSRKKKWSRSYIRHLRLHEPAKYKAHYDEIMAAYSENRVTK